MKITIIGAAGSVGAPAAFHIGALGLADEIVMIGGRRENVLKQHAMDLNTALSAQDILVRPGRFEDMAGSHIVINAAGVAQGVIHDRMELLAGNIPLVAEIASNIRRYCPTAFVITATNPVDPLNYLTLRVGGFDRKRVIGYSVNDSFRFREMLAAAFKVKTSRVEGLVLGEHGSTQVLLFSTAKIDGQSIAVSEAIKQRIRTEVPYILKRYEDLQAGRTAGWTCAVGLTAIVRSIAENRKDIIPCSVVLEGEYGQRELSMSVPVVIGANGVQSVLELELAPDERAGLDITAKKLRSSARVVRECLKLTP
jgi:malate dehydrogenase